jgi:F-type H+-transporting ATPase subunit epsilon
MTPLKQIYSGDVESLIAEATDGKFGVLVKHAPMLSTLAFSILTLREPGGKERIFVTSDGFFEIVRNKATVLIDTAEAVEDIDVSRAESAKQRAEERIATPGPDVDLDRAEAALHRALIRIKAARGN